MFQVYVLESEKNGSFYIGQTSNISERLKQHNAGESNYTKKYIPWVLKYSCAVPSRSEALKLERYLKNMKSRKRVTTWFEKKGRVSRSDKT